MRKRIAFRKLGRKTKHRKAMLKNMVCSLIEHERIVTTTPKAKELRRYAEKVVGYAKRWAVHQQVACKLLRDGEAKAAEQAAADAQWQLKLANSWVGQRPLLIKLLHHLGPRYLDRNGGYTRVLKLQKVRVGDAAPRAIIEYIDRDEELRPANPPQKPPHAHQMLAELLGELSLDDETAKEEEGEGHGDDGGDEGAGEKASEGQLFEK